MDRLQGHGTRGKQGSTASQEGPGQRRDSGQEPSQALSFCLLSEAIEDVPFAAVLIASGVSFRPKFLSGSGSREQRELCFFGEVYDLQHSSHSPVGYSSPWTGKVKRQMNTAML